MGETAEVGPFAVTLNSATRRPADGGRYAVVDLTLENRAHLGRPCGDGFAFVSPDGGLTVFDQRLRPVRQADLGAPVADFSVVGGTWAWIVSEQVWVGDFPGAGGVSAPLLGESTCRWLPSSSTRTSSTRSATSLNRAKLVPLPSCAAPNG